jgi:3-hydroxyacyl-CoA dehydrogenase
MRVGFIGLGYMGKPMAENIAKAGFDLTVYDIRTEAVEALERSGAVGALDRRRRWRHRLRPLLDHTAKTQSSPPHAQPLHRSNNRRKAFR